MKTGGFMLLVVSALITLVSVTFAQQRGLPPNVPPNPNWVVSPWGEPPGGSSWLDLKSVNSMTYDPHGQGSIVVLVTPKLRTDPSVWVFDYDGKLQRTWGADMFVRPYDMIVDRFGYLWIIDENQNFIAKFTEEGKQLMTIGQKGVAGDNSSHDAFNGPSGLAVAKNGDIFVADGYNNSRIVKFDKNGKFLMMIGDSKGSQIGQFDLPHHVLIDSKGELVIQDRVNKRIQFWTQDGKFIKQWTATNATDFMFTPQGNQTSVKWTMDGDNTFMGKAFGLFMNMDKMVGGDFEKGLAQLVLLPDTRERWPQES